MIDFPLILAIQNNLNYLGGAIVDIPENSVIIPDTHFYATYTDLSILLYGVFVFGIILGVLIGRKWKLQEVGKGDGNIDGSI